MTRSGVEYADFQITVYPPPCPYRCLYCFWNTSLMRARARRIREKFSFERRIEEARRLRGRSGTVVVSFTTDPYPPVEAEERRTRKILEALAGAERLRVMVLTKNPVLALRDLDLFRENGFWLGTTVTCLPHHLRGVTPTREDCGALEPYAPEPHARLNALAFAHMHGVKTWLSVEPIHRLTYLVYIVKSTLRFVDFYVFGAFNYAGQLGLSELSPGPEEYAFMMSHALPILEEHGKQYFIKKELREALAQAGYKRLG